MAGAAGLLAGLGVLAIPGLGPVVAAGWLASTTLGVMAGAATGTIVGALTEAGVSEEEAPLSNFQCPERKEPWYVPPSGHNSFPCPEIGSS